MTTRTHADPVPKPHFPYTLRLQAYEMAAAKGLHLVRDNYHLWAVRASDNVHVYLAHARSYDGLWRAACERFRDATFDPEMLPYRVDSNKETENQIVLFHPETEKTFTIDRKDLTSRKRGQHQD